MSAAVYTHHSKLLSPGTPGFGHSVDPEQLSEETN